MCERCAKREDDETLFIIHSFTSLASRNEEGNVREALRRSSQGNLES